jgi:hypothetical protein
VQWIVDEKWDQEDILTTASSREEEPRREIKQIKQWIVVGQGIKKRDNQMDNSWEEGAKREINHQKVAGKRDQEKRLKRVQAERLTVGGYLLRSVFKERD